MIDTEYWHWLCSVPIGFGISVVGLVGNIITVIVWKHIIKSRLRGNCSTALYFIALAVCDNGLLLFFLLTDSLKTEFPELTNNYSYAAFYSWIGFPFFFIFLVASIWLAVGVTINRFVMVTFPTSVRMIYSPLRTYIGIASILAFSFVVNIPHFFNFSPMHVNGSCSLELTEYGNSYGSTRYEFWAHCITLVLVPWFTIAVLNILIVRKLFQQAKHLKKKFSFVDKKTLEEKQVTRKLLIVTFSFLVLLAWQCVTQCFYMLGVGKSNSFDRQWNTINASFALAKLGVIVNSSTHWIFYCFSGAMFRKEMVQLFCAKARNDANCNTSFATPSSKSSKDSQDVVAMKNLNSM